MVLPYIQISHTEASEYIFIKHHQLSCTIPLCMGLLSGTGGALRVNISSLAKYKRMPYDTMWTCHSGNVPAVTRRSHCLAPAIERRRFPAVARDDLCLVPVLYLLQNILNDIFLRTN